MKTDDEIKETRYIRELRKENIKLKRENKRLRKINQQLEDEILMMSGYHIEEEDLEMPVKPDLKKEEKSCYACGSYDTEIFQAGQFYFLKCHSCLAKKKIKTEN